MSLSSWPWKRLTLHWLGPLAYIISYRAVVCALQTAQHHTAIALAAPRLESAEYVCRTATPNYREAMRSYLFSHSNRVISHYGVNIFFFPTANALEKKRLGWKRTHRQLAAMMHSRVSIVMSSSFENVNCRQTPRISVSIWIFYYSIEFFVVVIF